MRKLIHPQWYEKAKVTCACGNSFFTGATLPELKTEVCSQCHPFYTGKEKLIDTEGLVDKFERKMAAAKKRSVEQEELQNRKKEGDRKKEYRPRSLKEMLDDAGKQTNQK